MSESRPIANAYTTADGRPAVSLRTAEYCGDEPIELTFPESWELDVRRMKGHDVPKLTGDEIREALRNPVGARPLAEIAQGKETAVVTFDAATRPTPTHEVAPYVVEELRRGGITDENIIFQCSPGTHGTLTQVDMVAKLGAEIVAKHQVWNHDPFHRLTPVGITSRGNDVRLNSMFMSADVKVCISGVKPHLMAGYGGGGKAIVPGLAWIRSAAYLHHVVDRYSNPESGIFILNSEVRADVEEAARLARLDFSVNVIMNGHRQACGLFAGDVVKAHRAACEVAHNNYETEIAEDADVVIANAYPQSVEASKELRFARASMREGGSAVLIQDTPFGQRKIHFLGWSEREETTRSISKRPKAGLPVEGASQVIVFNRFHAKWDEQEFSSDVQFLTEWETVVELLAKVHGPGTRVAIYPTGPFQHAATSLVR